jgi:curved DNA-binding protein CbpA
MSSIRTHYDNLNVARNAPPEVIRAAYKALAQKFHPDKNPSNLDEAARIMTVINTSYEVLSDLSKRREHDLWIKEQEGEATQSNPQHHQTAQQPTDPQQPHRPGTRKRKKREAQPPTDTQQLHPMAETKVARVRSWWARMSATRLFCFVFVIYILFVSYKNFMDDRFTFSSFDVFWHVLWLLIALFMFFLSFSEDPDKYN